MITSNLIIPNIFSLIKKAIYYKSGSLMFVSAYLSTAVKYIFDILSKGLNQRDIILPLIVYAALVSLYIFTTSIDFYTGTRASRKEQIDATGSKKGYLKSSKLWSSVWKMTGVVVISNTIMLFIYIFLVLRLYWFYNLFTLGLVFFFLIVVLFDIHSIGENQERRFNKKPPIYKFLDRVNTAIQNKIINKI